MTLQLTSQRQIEALLEDGWDYGSAWGMVYAGDEVPAGSANYEQLQRDTEAAPEVIREVGPSADDIAGALLDASKARERESYLAEISRPIPFTPAQQEAGKIGLPGLLLAAAALLEFAN